MSFDDNAIEVPAKSSWYRTLFLTDRERLANLYGRDTREVAGAIFIGNMARILGWLLFLSHVVVFSFGTRIIDADTRTWMIPFIGTVVAIMAGSAWLVETGREKLARLTVTSAVAVSVVGSVIFCGGILNSAATPILAAPAVVAYSLLSRKQACLIAIAVFLFPIAVHFGAETFAVTVPDYRSSVNPAGNAAFCLLTVLATIAVSLTSLSQTNDKLREALEQERAMYADWAECDALTGLGNRRKFDRIFEAVHEEAVSACTRYAILYIDLDGFKPINDRLGHEAGDEALRILASRLKGHMREENTVARLGGDEFGIILNASDQILDIEMHIAAVDRVISTPMILEGEQISLGASIGHAIFDGTGPDTGELLRLADAAMYRDKANRQHPVVQVA